MKHSPEKFARSRASGTRELDNAATDVNSNQEEETAEKEQDGEEDAHLARYSEHNSRLQTWIGSYGAGFASLLVYQFRTAVSDAKDWWTAQPNKAALPKFDAVLAKMHSDLRASLAVIAVALALQVILLFVNKATQAALANPQKEGKFTEWWYLQSCRVSTKFSIDVVCDVGSVALLVYATVKGLDALRILS